MKNLKFTRVISAVSGAVLTAALLIGTTTAFGGAPVAAPPGNGIAPSFTGLNLSGNINFSNGGRLSYGDDFLGKYVSVGDDTSLSSGNSWVKNFINIGDVISQNLFIDSSTIQSIGNNGLALLVKTGRSLAIGDGTAINNLLVRRGNLNVNGNSVLTSGTDAKPNGSAALKITNAGRSLVLDTNEVMSIGGPLFFNFDTDQDVNIGSAAHRSKLAVTGLTSLENGLNVTGHSTLGSLTAGDTSVTSLVARGLVDARVGFISTATSELIGETTAWNLNVPDGATLNVTGDANLPFRFANGNFSNASTGNKYGTAVCPAGTIAISCQVYFNDRGRVYVRGSGTASIGDTCLGDYYQTSASQVSGFITATCL